MDKKILIIGTGSLRNYGCEAIVRGTYAILKKWCPAYQIYLASDDMEYDSSILPNDIKIIQYKKRITLRRIFWGILRRVFHVGNGSNVRMDTKIGGKFDVVLSCGGDNYCERPDFGIYDVLDDLMKIGRNTVKNKNKYFLWGSSVGPFHNQDVEKRVISNLSLTSKVFLRESLSKEYLDKFEEIKDKLEIVADPAFQMELGSVDFERAPGKEYIAINMSELAVNHVKSKLTQDADPICQFRSIIESLLSKNDNREIFLIPHVVIDGPQDDMNFLQPLYDSLDNNDRVHIVPSGLGAPNTKCLISKMDVLIAARMHCCVAGISTATPTLFLTYSNKGKGMSEYAYGVTDYTLECSEAINNPNLAVAKIEDFILRKDEIRNHLEFQQNRFSDDSMKAGAILAQSI